MTTVTIAGQPIGAVVDVERSHRSSDALGRATITTLADVRDQVSAGNNVAIDRGDETWRGYVTAIRTGESSQRLLIDALETRLELKHRDLHQVFYDVRSSRAVELAATTQAQALDKTEIHTGDNLTEWTSNAPVFQLYNGTRAGLYNWGTDLVVVGARQGHTTALTATYHDVTAAAIEDGIFDLSTRILVNDRGAGWDTEVELVTPDGTTYVWTPETPTSGFESLTLRAEDADPDAGQLDATGALQYRFLPRAQLANNTAILIDNAHSKPFRRSDRPTALSTDGVQQTERRITRRVDVSAGRFIQDLAIEDQYEVWTDGNVLHYEPDNGAPPLEISPSTTPVVSIDDERDYESIRNIVTVQGADDIEVTRKDQGSIAFYGPNPRPEVLIDKSIQSENEAAARAEGYLADHARDDASVSFTILDDSYADLQAEDQIPVDWPAINLSGTVSVADVTTQGPRTTVTITATSL